MARPSGLHLLLLSMTVALSCGDCLGKRPPADSPHQEMVDASPQESTTDFETFPIDERMLIRDGLEDSTNRFPSTIMVTTLTPSGKIECNGVIIAPRLVLTAGHCVCRQARTALDGAEEKAVIDNTSCAEHATVTTVLYSPATKPLELLMGARYEEYRGKVRPHPNLRILLDHRATPLTAIADLAVVFLDTPVAPPFQAVPLAREEAKPGEAITLVGYGQDETSNLVLGVRRFGQKKITHSHDEGGFLEDPGLVALTSGSGEPCLQQEDRKTVLVGITSASLEGKPTFTSVYSHKAWLTSEIERSVKAGAEEPIP